MPGSAEARTPPGPKVRGGFARAINLTGSALAMFAGGAAAESLMLAVAGRFTAAACGAGVAAVAWQAVKRIDRRLCAWAGR